MESVKNGMESTQSVEWHQAAENTPLVIPYAVGNSIHADA